MAFYKSYDIEIDFEDLIDWIEEEGLSSREAQQLAQKVRERAPVDEVLNFSGSTIMDEIASSKLQELVRRHGAESILSMVKSAYA